MTLPAVPSPAPPAAFDELAPSYDDTFSRSVIGSLLRPRVWRRLERVFAPGDRVLDLGCGTGEDALHLASRGMHVTGVDASQGMVDAARKKGFVRGPRGGSVVFQQLPAERIRELGPPDPAFTPFDGVLSNFGVLNCVEDVPRLARDLADLTVPAARVFLCVMGPVVPWEWGWFLWRGKGTSATRRLASDGVPWRGLRIRYPSIRATKQAFGSAFRPAAVYALGTLVPPTYAESWAERHRHLVTSLNSVERALEQVPGMAWLADHYLLELVRR
jgi:SAM-dependent methyltransferase